MSATEIRRKSAKTRRQTRTDELAPTVERNIQALVRRREQEAVNRTRQERIAEAVTAFTGSMAFVYLHFAIFGFWIVANLGWVPWVEAWDSSLVILAMVASVEAIFLSTFVLISQNRMAAADDKRAELNLQISLLAEHEITRLLELVAAVADRLDVRTSADSELDELKKDVPAEAVLDEIEKRERARPP